MKSLHSIKALTIFVITVFFSINVIAIAQSDNTKKNKGLEYLKDLKGKWVVQNDKEGTFGWEFDVTSRGGVVVERLKVGTPTEMTTTYYLDDGKLHANHFCQLQNQPRLVEVDTVIEGDLHFLCTGEVGNTKSHDELHMHGVHFKRTGDNVVVWMDMLKDGKVAFQTSYTLTRAE